MDKKLLLHKYPGKGGWIYALIPKVAVQKSKSFGWVKVKGTIDGFGISKYNLMSISGDRLFLPVRAEIRKKIKKEEGDYVHVILYPDHEPLDVPEELLLCLKEEPAALTFFNKLSEAQQKMYVQWIYSAKKEDTKVDRMAKAIDLLVAGKKYPA